MSLSSRITDLATAIGLAVKGKQNSLISGTNIKTINSQSILGSGDLVVGGGNPVGTIITFASSTAPAGYLKANGNLISRTIYSNLFAVIGTTFGIGDGSTTFALPDLRGYFPRGWDDSRGIDGSRVFGSLQNDELKAHSHTVSNFSLAGTSASGASTWRLGGSTSTNATGGTETRPKNIALLYCIKY